VNTRPDRKPEWLKVGAPAAGAFRATGAVLDDLRLHTVCDEARCPNKGECFSAGTATFLILGDVCTRDCGFCAVKTVRAGGTAAGGATGPEGEAFPGHVAGLGAVDPDEPARVAEAARRLGLAHVVITSVTRDDLADGGAAQFAATVRAVRAAVTGATVEVLVSDFGAAAAALGSVLAARPDVLGHNVETVPRLYPRVRPQAVYERSLELLGRAAAAQPRPLVKSGLMLGLGESADEVVDVLRDCAETGVDVVTLGQYLRPRGDRLPVERYAAPREFAALEAEGERLGLRVVAGPFVRSSYHAAEVLAARPSERPARGPRRRTVGAS
jgi:lipoic acid synthetase